MRVDCDDDAGSSGHIGCARVCVTGERTNHRRPRCSTSPQPTGRLSSALVITGRLLSSGPNRLHSLPSLWTGDMAGILAWFWNERFWLPHNVTWADLKNTEEATFPQAEDLYLACPLAFCVFMIRLLFERFIARPCAMGLKIQANGPQKAQPNAILEKVFTAITKHPDEKRLEGLSKQLDWDVRTIQRWFRQRRNQEKPSTLARFCESMWRFTFYLYIFTYGVRFLKKTSWLWNTKECWYNYPNQPLTVDVHYYYIVELSFYLSLLFSQFTDIRRKFFHAQHYIEEILCIPASSSMFSPHTLTSLSFCHASLQFPLIHCLLVDCLWLLWGHFGALKGFPDHAAPPRGGDLSHHLLLCQQHGASGNLGHVSPRCCRRADRGGQDGQLRQMPDSVQPSVCHVRHPLHKFQAGSLPCVDLEHNPV
ncbi:ceramide synthase 6 isoform 2-T2 [Synchiropus picturatus]